MVSTKSLFGNSFKNSPIVLTLFSLSLFKPIQLLDEDRFQSIEKIKTINGHIYMAACGLNPKDEVRFIFNEKKFF